MGKSENPKRFVVITEDEPQVLESVERLVFERTGFSTEAFATLQQFFDFLAKQNDLPPEEREPIQAFIFDGDLSPEATNGEDGRHAAIAVRSNPLYDTTFIIGNARGEVVIGADADAMKDPDILQNRMPHWISAKRD